jgi:uncharacterized membrane protein YheB (UPF0754 family)
MSAKVTLTLPDELYRRAEALADQSGRNVADVLMTTLNVTLPQPIEASAIPVTAMADNMLLATSKMMMDDKQQDRMAILLNKQQDAQLDATEILELSLLLYRYDEGSRRKAEALAEAVRRGLIPPLSA